MYRAAYERHKDPVNEFLADKAVQAYQGYVSGTCPIFKLPVSC